MSAGTLKFPNGPGNSPKVWNPNLDLFPLIAGSVRAGTWVLVQLSYRDTNTQPVQMSFGGEGFFMAHVIVTPFTDDSQPQKEGGRLQPTMYGGSATKQATSYHVDPGYTFQLPWDSSIAIVSGGVSDESVLVDVIVKLGYTPESLVDAPVFLETMMAGAVIATGVPHSQRVYAPPVVGHPELVPATYQDIGGIPEGPPSIPFPAGATAIQITDTNAITPAPTYLDIFTMGNFFRRMAFQPGQIEQLGAIAQGGGSTDGTPALWSPSPGTSLQKVVIWSKLGC